MQSTRELYAMLKEVTSSCATLWSFKFKSFSKCTFNSGKSLFPCGRTPYHVQRPINARRRRRSPVHAGLFHFPVIFWKSIFPPPHSPHICLQLMNANIACILFAYTTIYPVRSSKFCPTNSPSGHLPESVFLSTTRASSRNLVMSARVFTTHLLLLNLVINCLSMLPLFGKFYLRYVHHKPWLAPPNRLGTKSWSYNT